MQEINIIPLFIEFEMACTKSVQQNDTNILLMLGDQSLR